MTEQRAAIVAAQTSVKAMGVDCLAVSRWQDTALVIQTILGVT